MERVKFDFSRKWVVIMSVILGMIGFMLFVMVPEARAATTISSAAEFAKIGKDPAFPLNGHYELGGNLNLLEVGPGGSEGWMPIGSSNFSNTPFIGMLDGKGFKITGFYFNREESSFAGLFGELGTGSVVKNLTLENVTLMSTDVGALGALAGINRGTIDHVTVSGYITGAGSVGGLVGNNFGTITGSSVNVHVVGTQYVGGLVGVNERDASIVSSIAAGSVKGTLYVGGFAGEAYGNFTDIHVTASVEGTSNVGGMIGLWKGDVNNQPPYIIQKSSAEGSVKGTNNVGGLIGLADTNTLIIESSASGNVEATGDFVGGLIGDNNAEIRNSQASGDVSGANNVGGLIGITHLNFEIKDSTASGNVVGLSQVGGLIGSTTTMTLVTNSNARGSVTSTGSDSHDIGGLIGTGDGSISNSFAMGDVTAQGNYVGGLIGSKSGNYNVNSSYATGQVIGRNYVGGLIGGLTGPTAPSIQHSFATGTVQGNDRVGGLIGVVFGNAPIINNFASGQVTGVSKVGGLIGQANGVAGLEYNAAFGDITGLTEIGGLIGESFRSVNYNYAAGNVTTKGAGQYVGGLIGRSEWSISNDYATGNVNAPGSSWVGGLVGYHAKNFNASFYATGDIIDAGSSYGGLIGNSNVIFDYGYYSGNVISGGNNLGTKRSLVDMTKQSSFSGFSFVNAENLSPAWLIVPNHTSPILRNGYAPTPSMQLTEPIATEVRSGDQISLRGTVTVAIPGTAVYEHPKRKPLYTYVTILDPSNNPVLSELVLMEAEAKATQSFDYSVDVNDRFKTSGTYKLQLWTVTTRGGVAVVTHVLQVISNPTITITAKLDNNGAYNEGDWSKRAVIVSATFANDDISKREYALVGSDSNAQWQPYVGPVTVSSEGSFTVKFRTENDTGQKTQATFEVHIDQTAPSSPTLQPTGPINASGWANGPVTVSLTDGTDLLSEIDRTEYKLGVNGAWVQYGAPFQISNEGTTTVYARSVDKAGNMSIESTLNVRVDVTAPTMPQISAAGPFDTNDWANGEVTVTITSGSDPVSGSGIDVTQYKLDGGEQWSEYTAAFNVSSEGITTVYARTLDKAGNSSDEATFDVKIDYTPPSKPEIKLTAPYLNNSDWVSGDVKVTITDGADRHSGVQKTEYKLGKDGDWETYIAEMLFVDEGIVNVYARSVDFMGLISEETVEAVQIDKTPPLAPTIEVDGMFNADGWAGGPLRITIIHGVDALSGVAYSQYDPHDGKYVYGYDGPFQVKQEGITTIDALTVDKAANAGPKASVELKIDLTAPSKPIISAAGPIHSNGWADGKVTVSITNGSDAFSGADYTQFKLDSNGEWTEYSSAIDIDSEGITTIYARTVDKVGHVSEIESYDVLIDLTPPSAPTFDLDQPLNAAGWATDPVAITINSGNDLYSGVDVSEYKIGDNGNWMTYTVPLQFNTEGSTAINARTIDKIGKVSAQTSLNVNIDWTAPSEPTITLTGAIDSSGMATGTVKVTIGNGTDTLSGIDYTEYKLDLSGNWTKYTKDFNINSIGTTTIYARTVDKAGNISAEVTEQVQIVSKPSTPPSNVTPEPETNISEPVVNVPEPVRITLQAGQTGTAQLGDFVTVTIPAGSTDQELELTIEKVLQDKVTSNEQAGALLSDVYEFLKNFTESFTKPISLTFAFDVNMLEEGQQPSVFYYDEQKQEWIEIGGTWADGEITVEVNHFTKFAVFAINPKDSDLPLIELSDINGHWAEQTITEAIRSKLVSGYPDGTFRPNKSITRAEFTTMLVNALGVEGKPQTLIFVDQYQIGSWAQTSVAKAVQAGIVSGYGDNTFRPNAQISRAEMAEMIARALQLKVDANSTTSFADDRDIPKWAKSAIAAIHAKGIISGRGDNRFAPTRSTTRAEALTVISNALRFQYR